MGETQQQQHEDNIQVAKDNKKSLSFSINVNSVLTTVFGLAIMAVASCGWNELKGTHDTVLQQQGKLDTIQYQLDDHKNQLQKIWESISKKP
jgi:hypothetical protein